MPVALVPAAAVLVARRRSRTALTMLQLEPPGPALGLAAAAAVATALLVVAAARPTLVQAASARVRSDAELFVVLDTSRSMSARASPASPTRLMRARQFAIRLRAGLPEIPAGVASFTDRVLPAAMPTVDAGAFDATVNQAIGIDRPPPKLPERVATDYTALQQLPEGGSFAAGVRHRLLVVLTDGESAAFAPGQVLAPLRRLGTGLLVVRFWHANERVFVRRRPVSYRPNPASRPPFDALGAQSVGGRVFGEGDTAAAAAAARGFFGSGPTVTTPGDPRRIALAPYLALVGFAVLALLSLRRGGARAARTRLRRRALPSVPAGRAPTVRRA